MIDEAKQAAAASLVDNATDLLCSAAVNIENGRRLESALQRLSDASRAIAQATSLVEEMRP